MFMHMYVHKYETLKQTLLVFILLLACCSSHYSIVLNIFFPKLYLFLGLADESQHFVQVRFADQRPHARAVRQRIPHWDGLGPLHHFFQELGHNLSLDVHSGPVAADLSGGTVVRRHTSWAGSGPTDQQQQVRPHLPLRQEVRHERALHCIFQLTVFKDEEGGLPPQLQGHVLHPFCRHFHHLKERQRGWFLLIACKEQFKTRRSAPFLPFYPWVHSRWKRLWRPLDDGRAACRSLPPLAPRRRARQGPPPPCRSQPE